MDKWQDFPTVPWSYLTQPTTIARSWSSHTSRHKQQKSAARSTISSIDEHQWCPNGPITAAEHVRPLLWKVGTDLEISWITDCICYFGEAGYSVGLYGASSSGKRFGPFFEDKKSSVDPEILHKKFYPQKKDQIRSTAREISIHDPDLSNWYKMTRRLAYSGLKWL